MRAVYPRHTYCLEPDPRESPALHVSCGVWRLLLNYLFTMLIRTLFFALPALAIAISGYTQVPATVAPPQRNAGPGGQPVPDQDTVSRLQIFLDEHSFGPGKIDGRWGEFLGKALQGFQAAHGQQPSGQIDSALQQELQKISPVYTTYTLTDGDLHWVGTVPSTPAGMAQMKIILSRPAFDYDAERTPAEQSFFT